VDVLIYNAGPISLFTVLSHQITDSYLHAGSFQRGRVEDIEAEQFENTWKANCMGAFLAAKEVF
jgi:NAD(P)-dependent dehydrogenase (short-subunit alcohol dehydrogenase family)